MSERIYNAIKALRAIPAQDYDLKPVLDIVEDFDLTAVELLEMLSIKLATKPQPLDEDAAICRRVGDVEFRLANGELTPEVVCLAAIAARDYHACFGKYPDSIMPPAHYEAFDDWIADLAAGATGYGGGLAGYVDNATRFRAGDLNK